MPAPWHRIPERQQRSGQLLGTIWVCIQAWEFNNHWILGILGPEGCHVNAGYSEWEVIPMPRAAGVTEWRGRRNFQMSLDLLIDGWHPRVLFPAMPGGFTGVPNLPRGPVFNAEPSRFLGRSRFVQDMCDTLELFALRQGSEAAPRGVRLFGAVPHTNRRWVVNDLEWGDAIRDSDTGKLQRQQVTVQLLEYNSPQIVERLPRGKAAA